MTISIRFSDQEARLIKEHANHKKISVSQLLRESILADLEEEYDVESYYQALKEHQEQGISYSHDQAKQLLDLE